MSRAAVSVGIFAVFMVFAVSIGLLSLRGNGSTRQGRDRLAEWTIGGRSLGAVLIWVLTAGETYTSFSYLGASGWAYSYGMPAFYVLAYLAIGFAVGYVVGPMLWHYARNHDLHTISDLVTHRFAAPWLGAVVAVLATVFLLPYIQLQLTGMGVVVSTISYGTISLNAGYLIAFVVTTAFIVVSGLRGSAWVSVLKDALAVVTLVVLFVYVPLHYFGGYGALLDRLIIERPGWLTLPGHRSPGLGLGWFFTTGLLNGVVITVFPTTVAGYLGARNAGVLRRNAIFLPFYQILLFVPILLGLAALFVVPGLKDSNLALFRLIIDSMPPWLVGLIGTAGALSSIVPMGLFMLVIGTMWGRSVLGLLPGAATRQKPLAQLVVFLAGLIALVMTYTTPNTLVRLSVMSYEAMAQLLPVVLLSLLWRRMSAIGAMAGLAVGVVVVVALVSAGLDPVFGINAGLLALAGNLLVNLAVSMSRPSTVEQNRLAVDELAAAR